MIINIKIGTLGDERGYLTCSMYVANKIMPGSIIEPYQSFENAVTSLEKGDIALVLVPAAYSLINHFIMDDLIYARETFIEKLPPLVVVTKDKHHKGNPTIINKVYLHHATRSLAKEIPSGKKLEMCEVNSNIEACELLLLDNERSSGAITNTLCANYFKLNTIKILRESVDMPWILFARK